jgi:crotonobetainyl-CoA:carnitine CoA-transferase CaiB-like acyl-CoA transferase
MTLDLRSAAGMAVLQQAHRHADVVMDNYRRASWRR